MTKNTLFTCLFGAILCNFTFSTSQAEIKKIQSNKHHRALIIGLDGTTGNQLHSQTWKRNKAPSIREFMKSGIYTVCESDQDPRCARTHSGHKTGTDFYWLTGPGWASVLTGVDNTKHLVKDNQDDSLKVFTQTTQQYPSLFARAKSYGLKTSAAGVGAFITSRKKNKIYNGIVDYECGFLKVGPKVSADATESCNLNQRKSFNNADPDRDNKLTEWLINQINNSSSDIIMGVFDLIDSAGHSYGFDSNSNYLKAISNTDVQIGKILNSLKARTQQNEEWLVLMTSDHGGHRLLAWGLHGSVDDEDEVIPFVMTLIGSDKRLAPLKYPVTHLDVHPTVMEWFGIPSPQVDGKIQGLQWTYN